VIHTRDADDTFRVLEDEGVPARAVFHCWSGGPAEAARALDLGAYLSFSGIVSFKNADDVKAAAALVPIDRVLVETDAPYLAPVPHRGKPNEPAWVAEVGVALAAATGRETAEVAAATRANATTVFSREFPDGARRR
jgi:TatD DNase family protein